MEAQKITLPSGRVISLHVPTMLDIWKCTEHVPDLAAPPTSSTTPEPVDSGADPSLSVEAVDLARRDQATRMRLICECSVEPRFWADLRTGEECAKDPRTPPAGAVVFDLTLQDFAFASHWLDKEIDEQRAAIRPISGTAEG